HRGRDVPHGSVVGVFFGYTAPAGNNHIGSYLRWFFNDLDDAGVERAKVNAKLPPGWPPAPDGNSAKLQAVLLQTQEQGELRSALIRERGWSDTFIPAVRNGPGAATARRLGV